MCSCHLSDNTLGCAQLLVLKLSPGRFELEGSVHHTSIGTREPSLRKSQRLLRQRFWAVRVFALRAQL